MLRSTYLILLCSPEYKIFEYDFLQVCGINSWLQSFWNLEICFLNFRKTGSLVPVCTKSPLKFPQENILINPITKSSTHKIGEQKDIMGILVKKHLLPYLIQWFASTRLNNLFPVSGKYLSNKISHFRFDEEVPCWWQAPLLASNSSLASYLLKQLSGQFSRENFASCISHAAKSKGNAELKTLSFAFKAYQSNNKHIWAM
jgi:hypothetical protein